MPAGDKMHVQVTSEKPETLEIIEDVELLIKVPLKDRTPPVSVTFGYNGKEDQLVTGYYSTEYRKPNHGSGELIRVSYDSSHLNAEQQNHSFREKSRS
jgi:hypothetical protein